MWKPQIVINKIELQEINTQFYGNLFINKEFK